jgi:hypothetical protein
VPRVRRAQAAGRDPGGHDVPAAPRARDFLTRDAPESEFSSPAAAVPICWLDRAAEEDGMGVKGSAIESVVADVNRLVDEGRIAREALEARLPGEDLHLLEAKIVPALWYPYGSYGRLMELLFEAEGRRSTEYLVERGRRAADRVRAMGLYAQLKGDWANWGDRVGTILATLGPAMYKDTQWRIQLEGQAEAMRFRLEVDCPAEFPDVCRWPTQGFIEYVARMYQHPQTRVRSERVSAERMVFHGASR